MPRFLNIKDVSDKLKKPHVGRYKRMLRDALSNPALTAPQRADIQTKLRGLGVEKPYGTLRATREAHTAALLVETNLPAVEPTPAPEPEVVPTTKADMLALLKDELLNLAEREGVAVQRSWSKARIADDILANRTER